MEDPVGATTKAGFPQIRRHNLREDNGEYHHEVAIQEEGEHNNNNMNVRADTTKTTLRRRDINNNNNNKKKKQKMKKNPHYFVLLAINYCFLFVGSVSSTLLSKFYFVHKGSSRWVSTVVQCAGFPLLIPAIYLPYLLKLNLSKYDDVETVGRWQQQQQQQQRMMMMRRPFDGFTRKLLLKTAFIGLMLGVNNLLFSWGNSYLPVSTSSLLLSSQLAFTLIFSVLIVKQRVTFSNLNCVVLLTLASLLLAFRSSSDRPAGLTQAQYFAGFFSTVGAGLLFALYLPLMERVYGEVDSYSMVMEMQLVMEAAATALAVAGMVASGGFAEAAREGRRAFDLGPGAYWATLAGNVVTWQLCFLGTAGMVFLTTSITGGICMTALMAMNVVGGVVAFRDEFGGVKAVATLLCVWGFCSYVYGIYVEQKQQQQQLGNGSTGSAADEQQQQQGEQQMIQIIN